MTTSASRWAPWTKAARQAVVSGSLASVFSTALLAVLGKRKLNHAAAPTNATSHWLWGEEAYRSLSPTWRHTALGYVTHHASAIFWATFCERWLDREAHRTPAEIATAAAVTTAGAAFVDYVITPPRLRPGFEQHLSRGALVAVFAAIGVGLAAGAMLNRQHERRLERLLVIS